MSVKNPITILIDTKERTPLDFSPYEDFGIQSKRKKLRTGDYSIEGYESHIFIERKSLNDLVGSLTRDRDRFTREIYDRGSFVPVKHLIVEASWREISSPYSFSSANPISIVNSLYSLQMPPTNIHIFADNSRAMCAWYVANVAHNFIRRATTGSSGMWRAIFAPDAADLSPLPMPYNSV